MGRVEWIPGWGRNLESTLPKLFTISPRISASPQNQVLLRCSGSALPLLQLETRDLLRLSYCARIDGLVIISFFIHISRIESGIVPRLDSNGAMLLMYSTYEHNYLILLS